MKLNLKNEIKTAFEPPEPKGRADFLASMHYPKLTYPEFILSQVGYIRKRVWLVSAAVVFSAVRTVCAVPEEALFLIWFIAAMVPFLAMLTTVEISRSRVYSMSEMEAACRFSLPQVTGARMIVLGVCNFAVIITASVLLGSYTSFGIARSALYIFTPYIVVSGISLMIFSRVKGQEAVYLSAAAAMAVSFAGIIILGRGIYEKPLANLYIMAVCLGGMLMAAAQTKKLLFGKDNYLWN